MMGRNASGSPTTPRQKNREYARQVRYGSPKLKDSLRQKCREKMRERRTQFFNTSRFGLEDPPPSEVQSTLIGILRDEFRNMSTEDIRADNRNINVVDSGPLSLEEALKLEQEMIEEEEQWIVEEYLKMMNEEIEAATFESILCPMCQKNCLEETLRIAKCKGCGLNLPLKGRSLAQFGDLVMSAANHHSIQCCAVPGFTVIPEYGNVSLCLVCHECSTFEIII